MKRTVLIIEDEPDYLSIAAGLLEAEGFSVLRAPDGAAGLALALSVPDLVVLDIGLPDTDGITVVRKLKASPATAAIPVILFTVRSELDYVRQGLAAGALEYIIKPFDPDEFVKRVRGALGEK